MGQSLRMQHSPEDDSLKTQNPPSRNLNVFCHRSAASISLKFGVDVVDIYGYTYSKIQVWVETIGAATRQYVQFSVVSRPSYHQHK
jgi:hypothetical protein